MIKYLTDLNECDKILRNYLIKTSLLKPENILNGLSMRGVDLRQLVDDNKVYNSYKLTDNFIIFETYNRSSNNNVELEDEPDGTVNVTTSLTTKCMIYGNTSNTLAHRIKGRISSDKAIDELYFQGILLEDVSDINTSNEFINDTIWIRHYFNINYSVRLRLPNIQCYEDFEIASIKEVIKV